MENNNRKRKGWIEGAPRAVWPVAIVFASVFIGVGLSWRMPEMNLAARDWLLRSSGEIAPPQRIGRQPSPRRRDAGSESTHFPTLDL
jgi:hypothetical protein